MTFDRQRALDVIAQRPRHCRGVGRTTAACYQLLADLNTYPRTIFYFVRNGLCVGKVVQILKELLETEFTDIAFTQHRDDYRVCVRDSHGNGFYSTIKVKAADSPHHIGRILDGHFGAKCADDLGEWSEDFWASVHPDAQVFVRGRL